MGEGEKEGEEEEEEEEEEEGGGGGGGEQEEEGEHGQPEGSESFTEILFRDCTASSASVSSLPSLIFISNIYHYHSL